VLYGWLRQYVRVGLIEFEKIYCLCHVTTRSEYLLTEFAMHLVRGTFSQYCIDDHSHRRLNIPSFERFNADLYTVLNTDILE